MSRLVGRLLRTGLRRGVLEGSRGWWYIGVTAAVVSVARRVLSEPEETVFEAELKPGERIEVRTLPREPGRRQSKGRR